MRSKTTILGIDPGTQILGFGVISTDGISFNYITSGVLDLRKIGDPFEKLMHISNRVKELISEFHPDIMAIEAPFYGKNVQSMLKLGRAQGAAISSALVLNVPVFEYAPRKIKLSVTGKGAASKEQVASLLSSILKITINQKFFDSTDALAVAFCHAINGGVTNSTHKSSSTWDSFVKNNPGRIK